MAKTFGRAVRAAREARGLTLRQVAKAAGMSAPQLSSLESGKPENPGWATVVRLAKALGMSLDEAAGLSASKAVAPGLPRGAHAALERAQKDIDKAVVSFREFVEKFRE